MAKRQTFNWVKNLLPALVVLLLSIVYAAAYGDFAPLTRWRVAAWMAPLRFVRFTLVLCIPLLLLPTLYRYLVREMAPFLVRVDRKEKRDVIPLKHWFFRPIQGIGIGLIFGAKLIAVLQLISGPVDESALLMSQGYFQYGRLMTVTLITVAVALLLSILWTFDDMGVRYFNERDQELKMIGKYVGTILPFIFGVYGILSLRVTYSAYEAFLLALEIAVVLYPPLTVFAIVHAYLLKKGRGLFPDYNIRRGIISF